MEKQNERQKNINRKRRERYLKKRMRKTFVLLFSMTAIGVVAAVISNKQMKKMDGKTSDVVETSAKPADNTGKEEPQVKKQESSKPDLSTRTALLEEAGNLAAGYDYDGAIDMIKSYEGYENDTEMKNAITDYEARKASCVPVNINEVTHIFYHTLVVDPELAFANQETDSQAVGNNQWMTTIDEFNKITQSMYDKGYVLVDLHDIAEETTDANGETHYKEGTIMLPPDKKAYVLSLDDLSYYHSYDGYGYASKIVLDEEGKPKCEYIQRDGTTVVGDYDVVPLMDKFLEEHPDASYKGAKGTIALTGYNGVLGYRTDISYQTRPDDLDEDKKKWLEAHPDFDLDTERANAKKVADAMKADGWKFASHTWGHLRVGTVSFERLQNDTTRWKENVEPIVGATDTIIFAHGEDLAGWNENYEGNDKYEYLKGQGFHYFCNVDSKQYSVRITENYVRQGRRNLDGYRIYFNSIGETDNVSDLFNASEIIDPKRPPVHKLGN